MLTNRYPGRSDLQPGQISRVIIHDLTTGAERIVHESDELVEAPNWTPDGTNLIVNSQGHLWSLPVGGGALCRIVTGEVHNVNNDHVLSPDGAHIYFSAGGHLYRVPIDGGPVVRISNDHPEEDGYTYWLHGVSPDEQTLAYVSVEPEGDDERALRNLALIPAAGGPDRKLTRGSVPYDGPEYSPDGVWIYYNSEEVATRPGHAQIFRMPARGGDPEQLTFDERVNWFPHLDPTGRRVLYISYAAGTISHPADVQVQLRMIPAEGGNPTELVTLFGGQGTLNVNSWSPDGTSFAYVAYPIPGETE